MDAKSIQERARPDSHSALTVCPSEEHGLILEEFLPSSQKELAWKREDSGRRAGDLGYKWKPIYVVVWLADTLFLWNSALNLWTNQWAEKASEPWEEGHTPITEAAPCLFRGLARLFVATSRIIRGCEFVDMLVYLFSRLEPDYPRRL